ncbi:MAG: InlB B-repeat-containing protein, partial [Lachnospiraceae bacterium]|nr:InlB B-repeat-containing protein [Lachnospiraceae bacterium]
MKGQSRKRYLITGLLMTAMLVLGFMSKPVQAKVTVTGTSLTDLSMEIGGTLDATSIYRFDDIYDGDEIPDVSAMGLSISAGSDTHTDANACIHKDSKAAEAAFVEWISSSNLTAAQKKTIVTTVKNDGLKKKNTAFSASNLHWYECSDANGNNPKLLNGEDDRFKAGKYYLFDITMVPGNAGYGSGKGAIKIPGAFTYSTVNFGNYGTGTILGSSEAPTFTSPVFSVKSPTVLGSNSNAYTGSVNVLFDSAYGGQTNPAVKVTPKDEASYTHIDNAEARFERYYPDDTTLKWRSMTEDEAFETGIQYRLAVFLTAARKYKVGSGYKVTLYDSSNRSFELRQETSTDVYSDPYYVFYGPAFEVTNTDPWTGSDVGETDGKKWIKLKVSAGTTGGYDEAALENLLAQHIISHTMTEGGKTVYVLYEADALKVKNLTLDYCGDKYGRYPLNVLKYLTNLEDLTFRPNGNNVAESDMYDIWSSSDPHNFTSLDLTGNIRLRSFTLEKSASIIKASVLKLPKSVTDLSLIGCTQLNDTTSDISGVVGNLPNLEKFYSNDFTYNSTTVPCRLPSKISFNSNKKLNEVKIIGSKTLTYLTLPNGNTTDLEVYCPNCSALETVNAYGTTFVDFRSPAFQSDRSFEGCSSLKTFTAQNATIYSLFLDNMPNLTTVDLTGAKIKSGKYIYSNCNGVDFSSCEKLSSLNLSGAVVNENAKFEAAGNNTADVLLTTGSLTLAQDAVLDLSNSRYVTKLSTNELNLSGVTMYAGATVNLSKNPAVKSVLLPKSLMSGTMDYPYNVDLQKCNALESVEFGGTARVDSLNVNSCQKLASIDTSKMAETAAGTTLECRECVALTSLGTLPRLLKLDAYGCRFASVTLKTSGQFVSGAQIDLGGNTNLSSVSIQNANLALLSVAEDTALTDLTAKSSTIKVLDAGACNNLAGIDIAGSNIGALDVHDGKLTSLGSGSFTLTKLNISGNQFTELSVKNQTGLTELKAEGNALESLDLSANTALKTLDVRGNHLMSLDLTGNTSLSDPQLLGQSRNVTGNYVSGEKSYIPLKGTDHNLDPAKVKFSDTAWSMEQIEDAYTGNAVTNGNADGKKANYRYRTGKGDLLVELSLSTVETPVVTFNPYGGTIDSDKMTQVVGTDGKLVSLPEPNAREGYTFTGWFTGKTDGTQITTDYTFSVNTTVYAHWLADETFTYTAHAAIPADCETPGAIAYWVRSDGKWFSDSEGLHQLKVGGILITDDCTKEQKEEAIYIAPLGHNTELIPAEESTCCSEGHSSYYRCTREGCGKKFKEAGAFHEVTDASLARPKNPDNHQTDIAHHYADKPNCLTSGWGEYYFCTGCEKYYKDAAMTEETSLSDLVIPATGHSMSGWTQTTAPTDTTPGEEERHCENAGCTYKETSPVPATGHTHTYELITAVEATCTEPGHSQYAKCKGCELMFDAEDHDHQLYESDVIVPALGHDMGEWVIVKEPTETTNGEQRRYCQREGCDHYDIEVLSPVVHKHVPALVPATKATCEEAGNAAYYRCEGCGKWFADHDCMKEITDPASVYIAPRGHNWGDWTTTVPATDTDNGSQHRYCLNDPSHEEIKAIPRTGHTHTESEPIPAKAATCMDTG